MLEILEEQCGEGGWSLKWNAEHNCMIPMTLWK